MLVEREHEEVNRWKVIKKKVQSETIWSKPRGAMIEHFYVRVVHQTNPGSLRRRRLPRRRNGLSRPEKTSGLCRFPSPRSKHRPWVPKGRKEPKSTGFHEGLKNCLKDFIILPSPLRKWRWAGWQLGWMQLIWLVGCQNLVERCTSRRSVPVPKLDRSLPHMLHTTPQVHSHPLVKIEEQGKSSEGQLM